MNALSDHLRDQAAAHRATGAAAAASERPDPRYAQSAEALEALADYAEAGVERGLFQMRYLLEHHVTDGRFAWADGQCGRSILQFGFDVPVRSEWDLEQFLMDLCDLAKSDAARHIGEHQDEYDRADTEALAKRFGIGVERVHGALDAGRGIRHVYVVGIPDWHELRPDVRAQLEAIDGAIVTPGAKEVYGDPPPLLVKNVPAASEQDARERIAGIVEIEPEALGVAAGPRVTT